MLSKRHAIAPLKELDPHPQNKILDIATEGIYTICDLIKAYLWRIVS